MPKKPEIKNRNIYQFIVEGPVIAQNQGIKFRVIINDEDGNQIFFENYSSKIEAESAAKEIADRLLLASLDFEEENPT